MDCIIKYLIKALTFLYFIHIPGYCDKLIALSQNTLELPISSIYLMGFYNKINAKNYKFKHFLFIFNISQYSYIHCELSFFAFKNIFKLCIFYFIF